jgi:hypothetical protein
MEMSDPILRFELFHGHLSELVIRLGRQLRDEGGKHKALSADERADLMALLEMLKLVHSGGELLKTAHDPWICQLAAAPSWRSPLCATFSPSPSP